MLTEKIVLAIKEALDTAPRNAYVAELHLQIIKHAPELKTVTGKEFCQEVGIGAAYATEFSKMLNLWPRLKAAGLDEAKI